jgi:hypothetical protein
MIDHASKEVSLFAGQKATGNRNGSGSFAAFHSPGGLCLHNDLLFVADQCNHSIKTVSRNRFVETLVGSGQPSYKDGTFANAEFNTPRSIALNPTSGHLLVTDMKNDAIRMINLITQQVSTVFKQPKINLSLSLRDPSGLCVNDEGHIFVTSYADSTSNRFIQLDPQGNVVLSIGGEKKDCGDGSLSRAGFSQSSGCCVGPDGSVYASNPSHDRVRKIELSRSVFTFTNLIDAAGKWPESCTKLIGDDVLTIAGVTYRVHRQLLAVRCPSLLVESTIAELNRIQPSVANVRRLLTYIYSDNISKSLTFQELLAFGELCSVVKLPRLVSYLRELLVYLLEIAQSSQMMIDFIIHVCYSMKQPSAELDELLDLVIPHLVPMEQKLLPHVDCLMDKVPHIVSAIVNKCHDRSLTSRKPVSLLLPPLTLRLNVESLIPLKVRSSLTCTTIVPSLVDCVPSSEETNFMICGDKSTTLLPCHAWVMAARWPYFNKMLQFGGTEASEQKLILPVKISADTLASLIIYMYSGRVVGLNLIEERVILLKCALEFGFVDTEFNPFLPFKKLVSHCFSDFSKVITANEEHTQLLYAHLQHGSDLHRTTLLGFIKKHALGNLKTK